MHDAWADFRTRGTALGKIQRRERLHRLAPAGEKTRTRRAKSVHEERFKRDARVLLLEEATVRCMRGLFRNENDGRSRELVSRRRNEKRRSMVSRRVKTEDAFDAQNVGNILWAFATMLYTPRLEILDKFADIIEENVDKLYPQALSNSLWSFARLKEWNFLRCKTIVRVNDATSVKNVTRCVERREESRGDIWCQRRLLVGLARKRLGTPCGRVERCDATRARRLWKRI